MGMKQILVMMAAVVLVGCGGKKEPDLRSENIITPDEAANELFVEAVVLVGEAKAKEVSDVEVAIKKYEEALAKLQEIISDYKKSALAVKLISGETLFDGESLEQLKKRPLELAIAAAAAAGYAKAAEVKAAAEAKAAAEDPNLPVPIVPEGESIVVNPAGSGGTRFMLVEIFLLREEETDTEFPKAVESKTKQLQAVTMNFLSAEDVQSLSDPATKERLKAELKQAFGKVLGNKHPIKELIVSKWIMQ